MKKRILAMLLVLAMCLTVSTAFAKDQAVGGQSGSLSQGSGGGFTTEITGSYEVVGSDPGKTPGQGAGSTARPGTSIEKEETDAETGIEAELPTATVTELDVEALKEDEIVDLTYGLRFTADEATEEQLAAYGDWYADFVLTLNKTATFCADEETGADGYLAGFYANWSENWLKVPFEPVTVEAGQELKIMETAADIMGEPGLKYTYGEVYEYVEEFDCGAYFTPEFLAENPDLKITLELRIYNNEDESEFYVIGGETYEFEVVALPTATVTELEESDVDLTYGLRFTADEATEEQLEAYGDWYADFVLTLNKTATFCADEETGADGYLAGFYAGWSDEWVKVPFEPVAVEAGQELKIMETAAEMMGQPGLKVTYADVYNSVEEFDCGIFFAPEFLAANPDLETTLELRIYHPESDSVAYTIGEAYTFKRKAATSEENVVIQGATATNSNTVKIESIDVSGATEGTESVTIDTTIFVEEEAVVDAVSIPASAIAEVKELGENAELNITLANGAEENITVSVNKEALEAIISELPEEYEGSLTLKVEETKELTENQEGAVEELENNVVYKIVFETEEGEEIYTTPDATDNRKIVINLYYEKSEDAGKVVVKHIKDNGKFENVPFTYKDNIVSITLSHFSEYVIYQKEKTTSSGGSGGSSVSRYSVQFNVDGGSAVESQKVVENGKITKPADPTKEGFTFEGWYTDNTFTTAYDFEASVTKSFTLYAKWAEAEKAEDNASSWFVDVAEADWYYADVKYAYDNKLMNGTSDTTFNPNGLLTRAMLVTILYRNEGEPAVNRSIPFADIDLAEYYANAVIWAQQNGIVNGVSETEFAPNNNITREQIAAIIFRYAQFKGMEAVTLEENLHFEDSEEISEYAVSAMNWAVGTGLLKGKTETTLNPADNATRAEIAAVLHRFIEANK